MAKKTKIVETVKLTWREKYHNEVKQEMEKAGLVRYFSRTQSNRALHRGLKAADAAQEQVLVIQKSVFVQRAKQTDFNEPRIKV